MALYLEEDDSIRGNKLGTSPSRETELGAHGRWRCWAVRKPDI